MTGSERLGSALNTLLDVKSVEVVAGKGSGAAIELLLIAQEKLERIAVDLKKRGKPSSLTKDLAEEALDAVCAAHSALAAGGPNE